MIDIEAAFTAYVQCALWSSSDYPPGVDPEDNPDAREVHLDAWDGDITDESLAEMRRELTDFCTQPRVIELVELTGMDPEQVGHDFWLTRNHHGAGFWARDHGAAGDELTKLCHPYGESYLHIDENGSIYVS